MKFMKILGRRISTYSIFLFLIVFLGGLLRVYKFPYSPDLTDEIRESLTTYSIYNFEKFPLTNFTSYIGPIYNYALAVLLWLFNINVWIPRYFVMVLGILLIPISYLWLKKTTGELPALLGALYISLSPTLILINSRIAWSNCLTPIFTVITLIFYERFIDNPKRNTAIWFGLFLGLTSQIHPLMFIFCLLIGAYSLIAIKLKSVEAFWNKFLILIVSGIAGFLPLIVANIIDPGISLKDAGFRQHISPEGDNLSISFYLKSLDRQLAQIEHLSKQSIIFEDIIIPEYEYKPIYSISNPGDIFFLLILMGSAFVFFGKNIKYIGYILSIAGFLILAPLITQDFFEGLKIRYYAFLIPIFGLLIAYAIHVMYESKFKLLQVAIFLFSLILFFTPLKNIVSYYNEYDEDISPLVLDVSAVKSFANRGYVINYIPSRYKSDLEKPYAIGEFVLKYSGIDMKNTKSLENFSKYRSGEDQILLLPRNVLAKDNELILEGFSLINYKRVYDGLFFDLYK